MSISSSPPGFGNMPEGIEVVELADVDLEFAVEDAFREGVAQALEATRVETAKPEDLAEVPLFKAVSSEALAGIAGRCQLIHAVPGYVLVAAEKLNTKVFFVLEGQLRLYPPRNDKRPVALVDVGHSTGLHSALTMEPARHAIIATEVSQILAVDATLFDELAKRSHEFACGYSVLLASYVRGDNCVYIGARSRGNAARVSYIDELTLLHNQHWLETMFSRLVARYRMGGKSLSVVGFAIDKHEKIVQSFGVGPGLRVLQIVGHWLLDQTRPTDILVIDKNRHFFAFLPEWDVDAARELAQRLKETIKTVPFTLAASKPPIKISLSFGITALDPGLKENDFFAKAELLIRKSIESGGDCVSDTL